MNAPNEVANLSPSTALTVAERAAIALGVTVRDTRLAELAKASTGIVAITNAAGYQECHAARMVLKRERVDLEKTGKAARDDARAFADAVIAEERRLIAIIEPEEKRLQALQDAHDAEIERKRAAAAKAEADRKELIQRRIDWIRTRPVELIGKGTVEISAAYDALNGLPVEADLYGERVPEAARAKDLTLENLRDMHIAAVDQQNEAARLAEQKRQLDAKQAALDQQDRDRAALHKQEDDARAYLIAWDDAHREHQQRTEDAERARLRKIDDDARFAAQAEQDRKDEAARVERYEQEQKAAAERKRKRDALELAADPWEALRIVGNYSRIALEVLTDAEPKTMRVAMTDIERVAREALAARDALAALDK